MTATFIVSDTHFGHEKTCTVFKREDGSPLRPFANGEEMNEFMIKAWNERVRPNDRVYHLGDVVINRKFLHVLSRLNGDKVLVRGNHDIYKLEDYTMYFRDVRGYHVLDGMIFSHIPVHPSSLERFGTNIHGHLHAGNVMDGDKVDNRYFNACVEHHGYAPVLFEDVKKMIVERGGTVGFKERKVMVM